MKKISCVYKIVNTVNNKIYVGSTLNFQFRKNQHLSRLRHNMHANPHLQNSWNKYGESAFRFEIIEETNEYCEKEQYWLDTLKPEFNIRIIATSNKGISLEANKCENKYDFGEEFIKEIREIYKTTSLTKREIANKYNIRYEVAQNICQNKKWKDPNYDPKLTKEQFRMKVLGRWKGKSRPHLRKLSPEQMEQIKELNMTNQYSYQELADMFSCGTSTIGRVIRNEWGKQERKPKRINKKLLKPKISEFQKPKIERAILVLKMHRTGLYTQVELAEIFDCLQTTISRIILGQTKYSKLLEDIN